jgi:hypothetical protein
MTTTWNPSDLGGTCALSGGNLIASFTGTSVTGGVRSVDRVYTGQYYWECTFNTASNCNWGIANPAATLSGGGSGGANIAQITAAGAVYINSGTIQVNLGAIANGTLVCVALDATSRLIWFRVGAAGNWNGNAGNAPGGAGGLSVAPVGGIALPLHAYNGGNTSTNGQVTTNFGGSAFSGAVPSGYTSGFPSGTTATTSAVATQLALEQWASAATVRAQLTQIAVEQWASVATITPLRSTLGSRSFSRSSASVVFAGRILSATANARSQTRAGLLRLGINVAGRVKARASIRASLPSTVILRGRANGRSAARLLEPHASLVVMGAKASAQSGAGTFATIASTRTRQYAVSVIN